MWGWCAARSGGSRPGSFPRGAPSAPGRLSVCGELGYELNCSAAEHVALRRTLLEAGAGLGLREVGFIALLSLRLEKSFGVWNAEFTQGYTPGMTGLDRWIAWDKGDFVGRAAAEAERAAGAARRLVTLEVDSPDSDARGYEPVWRDGRRVGFVTSGGYGHTVGKILAFAYLKPHAAQPGTALEVVVHGVPRPAFVLGEPAYDPRSLLPRMDAAQEAAE